MRSAVFADRADAGRQLGARVADLRGHDVVVLGLPRGGVVVAAEVATALSAPLDVILVRKLGLPTHPELAMGAVGEDGVRVLNPEVLTSSGVSAAELAAVEDRERRELQRRADRYRGTVMRIPLIGRTAVVVDDGLATGSTARAACLVARAHGAVRVVLAVAVAPTRWTDRMGEAADAYVCVAEPDPFFGVGQFYRDFGEIGDDDVVGIMRDRGTPAA